MRLQLRRSGGRVDAKVAAFWCAVPEPGPDGAQPRASAAHPHPGEAHPGAREEDQQARGEGGAPAARPLALPPAGGLPTRGSRFSLPFAYRCA